jgi:hypothetical protein
MRFSYLVKRGKKSPEKIRIEEKGAQNQENRKLKYYKYTLFIARTFFLHCILQQIFKKNIF